MWNDRALLHMYLINRVNTACRSCCTCWTHCCMANWIDCCLTSHSSPLRACEEFALTFGTILWANLASGISLSCCQICHNGIRQPTYFSKPNCRIIQLQYRCYNSFFREIYTTILKRLSWANSADPDQTAQSRPRVVWSGSTLFAIQSASFGQIICTLCYNHMVQTLG